MKKNIYELKPKQFGHLELYKNGILILSPTNKKLAKKHIKETDKNSKLIN